MKKISKNNLKNKKPDFTCDAKKFMLTKKALLESRRKYQELIENINDAIYHLDSKGNFIYASPAMKKISGYDAKELIGRSIFDFIHPEERFRGKIKFSTVLSGKSKPFDARIIRKNGSVGYVRSYGRLLVDKNKKVKGVISVLTDITERKKAEQALREREEQFRNIYENAPFGIFHSTPEGKFVRVNPAFAKMLKYNSPEELIKKVNKTSIDKCLFAHPGRRASIIKNVMKTAGWYKFENPYICKDGKTMIGSVLLRKFVNPVTKKDEIEGFAEDITERKEAEANLAESYKYLGTINRQVSVLLEMNKVLDGKNKKGIADFIVWSALEISNSKFAALYKYQSDEKEKKFHLVSLASTADIGKKEKNSISDLRMKRLGCINDIRKEKMGEVEKCLRETSLEKFKSKYGVGDFHVLPILKKKEVAGVLILGFPEKKELNDQEKGFYNVFAKYATFILLDLGVLEKNGA